MSHKNFSDRFVSQSKKEIIGRRYFMPALFLFTTLSINGCAHEIAVQPAPAEQQQNVVADGRNGNGHETDIYSKHFMARGERQMVKQLPNGLTVIIEENHNAPIVAIHLWVGLGTADEPEELSGSAHLIEHLLFKGTEKHKVGEIAREFEALGGDINAFTSFDETVYYVVLAAEFFNEGLDVIADAVQNSTFDEAEFKREVAVIAEEEIKRSQDIPEQRVEEELFALAFDKHPYRRPVLGNARALKGFTRDKVYKYYKDNYTPDKMTVVIVGDVNSDKAISAVEGAFGKMQGVGQSPKVRDVEPTQDKMKAKVFQIPLAESKLSLGWKIPALSDGDTPALDVLGVILGYGESSRLITALKLEMPLVTDINAYAFAPKDPGLLMVSASFAAENYEKVLARILEEIDAIKSQAPSASEVEKAVKMITSEAIYRRETVEGEAHKLGYYHRTANDPDFDIGYYRRLSKITPKEIQKAAEKYLKSENLTAVLLYPKDSKDDLSDEFFTQKLKSIYTEIAKAKEKKNGADKEVKAPVIKKLKNGMTVVMKVEDGVPLVSLQAVVLAGSRAETVKTNGIHNFIANMLTRGTARMSGEELRRELDSMAAEMEGFSGRNSTGLKATFLARDFERGLAMFTDAFFNSAFTESELASERVSILGELRSLADDLPERTFNLFAKTLYTEHPYKFDYRGTEGTVSSFSREDLVQEHKKMFHPARTVMAIVGDFDPDRAIAQIEELVPERSDEPFSIGGLPSEPKPAKNRQVQIVTDKEQAHIVLGFLGPRITADDRYAVDVLNTVLAGQGGRLFDALREKKPLAYAVTSYVMPGIEDGFIAVYLGTSPAKLDDAIEGVLKELKRLIKDGITDEELARIKNHLVGMQAVSLQRYSARAAALSFNLLYGLNVDEHIRYAEGIRDVTKEDVQKAAEKYFDIDHYTVSVITPTRESK